MSKIINKVFPVIDNLNNLNFETEVPSTFGFIVGENEAFYLPRDKEDKLHHDDILKFTVLKIFKEDQEKYLNIFYNKIKEHIPNNLCFLDSPELTYSFFLTSLNNIVYLNSSDNLFVSGLLFVPENQDHLTDYQKQYLKKILEVIPKDNEDIRIATIPTIDKILNNECYYEDYSIKDYQSLQKGESICKKN